MDEDDIPEGTTVIGAAQGQDHTPQPYLFRLKTGEHIAVNKDVFRIGKERSYVDYCVRDNPTVSKSHAYIVKRQGECFLVDTNSTNHTFVNSMMLRSNTENKLKHGDEIVFANEKFEFKML